MIDTPKLVQTSDIGRVSEVVCGDSSTVARSLDDNKVYGWGRGHSVDRNLDVSRFKPKELASIETLHKFLVPLHAPIETPQIPRKCDLAG